MWQRRRIAAYGLCRDEAGRVLLAGDGDLPGGPVRHGEHPRDTAIRTFTAATGLEPEIAGVEDVAARFTIERDEVVHTDRIVYTVKITDGTGLTWGDEPVENNAQATEGQARKDPKATRMQRFAAYGLTTDPAGRFLLTRIADGYPGAGQWHLPGGGTDFGEQPADGLLRELVEETGQRGRIVGLLGVLHYHNPRALGPEKRPMDWHTVRVVYRVVIDRPGTPSVVEEVGGSTAEARWVTPAELGELPLNGFPRAAIAHHLGERSLLW
jgi:ADP-ribose pyrophosphatase YjhB (NUDIX family)